jgi:hypothetical protein
MSETASAAEQTPVEISGSEALASLTSEQRSEWFKTGDMPAPATPDPAPVVDEDAAEDAAEQAEQAAGAAPAAKPVPTPEKPISKRQQQINDLIRARAEADQRVAALEARLAQQQAPAAAPKAVEPTRAKPQQSEFETYDEFVEAVYDWKTEQRQATERAQLEAQYRTRAEQAQQAEQQTRMSGWAERMQAFAEKSPAFVEKAIPFLERVNPGTPLGDALMDSPIGPELALHLAEHPEELTRIGALHPIAALRELGKLESRLEVAHTSASAGPVAKHVSTAPAPPVTLGNRPADTADPVEAALGAQDFRAYQAAANRRELARK